MGKSDQGANRERYMLIPRTLVFLFREDQVLLLKGAENKRLWAGKYNGIGGHVEPGEDIYAAALRETQEETGLVAEMIHLCGVVTVETGQNPGIGLFVFRGEEHTGEPVASHEGSAEWIPITRLSDYPLVEDLYQLLPHIISMRAGEPPFAAAYLYDDEDRLVIRFAEA